MIILVILVYIFIAGVELPYLIKSKRKKELTAFSILFVLGLTYMILTIAGVPLPKIMPLLDKFFEDVLHIGYKK